MLPRLFDELHTPEDSSRFADGQWKFEAAGTQADTLCLEAEHTLFSHRVHQVAGRIRVTLSNRPSAGSGVSVRSDRICQHQRDVQDEQECSSNTTSRSGQRRAANFNVKLRAFPSRRSVQRLPTP